MCVAGRACAESLQERSEDGGEDQAHWEDGQGWECLSKCQCALEMAQNKEVSLVCGLRG